MKSERVGLTELPNGYEVSTVLITEDNGLSYYETIVFPPCGGWGEVECKRCSTLYWAAANHQSMIKKWGNR